MVRPLSQVYSLQGEAVRTLPIPEIFQTPIRPDIIHRAVVAIQSHRIQPQGRDPMAGKHTSAESRGTGLDLARVPRVKGGGPTAGGGALAPGTVGGRSAHPPVAEKKILKRINKKERRLAIRSAIAATADKQHVSSRGHIVDGVRGFPLIVVDDLQELKTAKEVQSLFIKLGVWADVLRVKEGVKLRGGKGPLIVIADDRGIGKAASNYSGVDVVKVENLNAELLAPGTHIGRLTVWTESAVGKLNELFR